MPTSHPSFRSVLFAGAGLFLLAAPLAAQIPGGTGDDLRRRQRVAQLEYRAEVLRDVTEILEEWTNDWRDGEIGPLADRYAEGAIIRGLAFGPRTGRDQIEAGLEDFLSHAGDIEIRLHDFEASGRLAYGMGRYEFSTAAKSAGSVTHEGQVVTVFQRIGGDWLIRSQTFLPDEATAKADGHHRAEERPAPGI